MKHGRFLSILLVLVMVFSIIPVFTRTADATDVIKETVEEENTAALTEAEISAEPVYDETSADNASAEPEKAALPAAGIKAEPTFTEVDAYSAGLLETYLEADGDYKIYLQEDIKFQIGKAGDTDGSVQDYWIELGSGIKVLYLQGHEISYSNDRFGNGSARISDGGNTYLLTYRHTGTLIKIGSGSELVINDPGNKGKITYKCTIRERDYELGGYVGRNLFHVLQGGKLTINGGRMVAGRATKMWIESRIRYVYLQTNGIAVLIDGGDVTINGGHIEGRGYLMYNDLDEYRPVSAIQLNSGSLKIYDGEIEGQGNAGPYIVNNWSKSTIDLYCGALDSHALDHDIKFHSHEHGPHKAVCSVTWSTLTDWGLNYTDVYIPDTNKYVSPTGITQGWATGAGRVEVFPKEKQDGFIYSYNSAENSFENVSRGTVIEWDKTTSLRFTLDHHDYYPQDQRSYDIIENRSFGNLIAMLCTSPNGDSIVPVLDHKEGAEWVDLNDLPQSSKDMLKVGNTYYLRLKDTESWGDNTITYMDWQGDIQIKIVEPDMTMPDLNIDMQFRNSLTGDGSNQITLIPAGDGSRENMDVLFYSGKISEYKATFSYYDSSATWKSISSDNQTGNTRIIDFYHGLSNAEYTIEIFKNGKSLGSVSSTVPVVCFPDLAADKPVDEFNRIYFDLNASDKKVVLSCKNANSTARIFWAKDGVKVSGSANKATWTVDASTSDGVGWWGLGYTVDGKDYFSDQQIYIGVNNSARSVGISTSSKTCTIKTDSDTTPTLTATTSSSGWGTMKEYRWYNISWPEGAKPAAKMRRTTSNTVTIGEVFCGSGSLTGNMPAGTYVFSVNAIDTYNNKAVSGTVSVTVSRPATGMQLWHPVESEYDNSLEVTDSFIVIDNVFGMDKIDVVFTPENAAGGTVTFSATGKAASVNSKGEIIGRNPGKSVITATYGNMSASTTIYVPQIEYEINIPDEWFDVTAGGTVHRGEISVGDSEPFTVSMKWIVPTSTGSYEYDKDTFESNLIYQPVLEILPKADMCYPVEIEYDYSRIWYNVEPDRMVFIVNGCSYYGATYCGRDYFYDTWAPISTADKNKDWITLYMDPTEKITDERDEYIRSVLFSLTKPQAGDPLDSTGDGFCLDCDITTEGLVYGGSSVRHVTDVSTIKDTNINNDAIEEFTEYKINETYRAQVLFALDKNYTNESGGRVFFDERVKAKDNNLETISSNAYVDYGFIYAYVYFTINDEGDYIAVDEINFPDANFRSYVASAIDTNKDLWLTRAEREAVIELNVNQKNIGDLTGVEYFYKLRKLNCHINNNLSSLDLSGNIHLEELNCSACSITALDVSKNTALTKLDCSSNQLAALDVSKNTALNKLNCRVNNISSLNLANNKALGILNCGINPIKTLDVTMLDLTELSCDETEITSLDVSKCWDLRLLSCEKCKLTSLNLSGNESLGVLYCYGNSLKTLNISYNPYLITTYTQGTLHEDEDDGDCLYNEYEYKKYCLRIDKNVDIATAKPQATFNGASLSLKDKISINAYMIIPDDAEGWKAEVYYEKDDYNSVKYTYDLKKTASYYSNSSNEYKISFPDIAAKEMTESIRIVIDDGCGHIIAIRNKTDFINCFEYCAADWANTMIAKETASSETKALAKALLNFGGEAQKYFDYKTDDSANPKGYLATEMAAVNANTLKSFAGVTDANASAVGLDASPLSLSLKSETYLNIYFNNSITATATNLDKAKMAVSKSGSEWVAKITGITAKNLGRQYTITVNGNGKTSTLKYSALSWAYSVLEKGTNAKAMSLAKALYLYQQAAVAYFKQ